ncbi:RraA family protein [Kaistia adipata]|uniref:RraA family protein n=1 Tax=Kaistia adipata TaxID=166954 RepID=UPI0005694B2D
MIVVASAELLRTLYTAVLSDVMDEMGYPNQACRPFMRPLDETTSFVGRARTGLYSNAYSVLEGENPYELEIRLIDDLKPGDVPVFACGGPTHRMAPWGELLTTAAMARGAVACVTDGLVRDVRHIRALKFPVFHGGIGPLDSKGRCRMIEMDRTIECGGVMISAGDTIFGDVDGVVVIPQAIADEVFRRALDKAARETHTRDELRAGRLLIEVYEKYGVL